MESKSSLGILVAMVPIFWEIVGLGFRTCINALIVYVYFPFNFITATEGRRISLELIFRLSHLHSPISFSHLQFFGKSFMMMFNCLFGGTAHWHGHLVY